MYKISYREILKNTHSSTYLCYLDNKVAAYFVYLFQDKKISPNTITTFSFLIAMFSCAVLIFTDQKLLFAFLLFVSYTLDNVDGIWARFKNLTSEFGGFLDGVSDRAKENIIFITLSLKYFLLTSNYEIFIVLITLLFFYSMIYTIDLAHVLFFKIEKIVPQDSKIRKYFKYSAAEIYLFISIIVLSNEIYLGLIIFSLLFLVQSIVSFLMVFYKVKKAKSN